MLVDLVIREVDAKLRQGEIELAYEVCNRALEYGATSAALLAKRGEINRILFRNARAIEDLSTAVKTAPSVNSTGRLVQAWETVVSLAEALKEAGEFLRAIEVLETYIPDASEVTRLYVVANGSFELGKLRRQIWQSDRAWDRLRKLSSLGLPYFNAEIESVRSEITELKQQISAGLKKIRTDDVTDDELRRLAECLCKYGKPRFACACLKRMAGGYERDPKALIVKFYALLRLRTVADAVTELTKYYDLYKYRADYVYCLSLGLLQLGDVEAAVQRLSALPLPALRGRCFDLLWRIEVNKRGRPAAVIDLASSFIADDASVASACQYLTALHLTGALRIEFAAVTTKSNQSPTRPKTILQFWDREPPEEIAALIAEWRQSNPTWTFRLFEDSSAREFLRANFGGDVAESYDSCHHPAMKSDMFRIAYLLIHGGVYIDADEKCLQPADAFFKGWESAAFAAVVSPIVPFYIRNGFISAAAGHDILSIAWDLMLRTIAQSRRERRKIDIWLTTGPGILTRAVAKYVQTTGEVATSSDMILITEHRYHQFAVTPQLSYKTTKTGNWRLA